MMIFQVNGYEIIPEIIFQKKILFMVNIPSIIGTGKIY